MVGVCSPGGGAAGPGRSLQVGWGYEKAAQQEGWSSPEGAWFAGAGPKRKSMAERRVGPDKVETREPQ